MKKCLLWVQLLKGNGIRRNTLQYYYENIGNIEEAVKLIKESRQRRKESLIEYHGARITLAEISRKVGVNITTLQRYYKKTSNIEKAVFMCKRNQIKETKVNFNGTTLTTADLAIILGIKHYKLTTLLKEGKTIEEIKEYIASNKKITAMKPLEKGKTTVEDRKGLLEYCIDNKLNYSCIYYMITQYGKTIEEAITSYRENGQNIPTAWIHERYGILLKHLMLDQSIDYSKVIQEMRKNYISLEEAVKQVVIKQESKGKNVDREWMSELYDVMTDEDIADDYDEYKKIFYINDEEEDVIISSYDRVETIKRKILLFEIADSFREDIFKEEGSDVTKQQVLEIYDITPEEVEEIYLNLYDKFKSGVLMTDKEPERVRKEKIRDITSRWINMTAEERKQGVEEAGLTEDEIQEVIGKSAEIDRMKRSIKKSKMDKEEVHKK